MIRTFILLCLASISVCAPAIAEQCPQGFKLAGKQQAHNEQIGREAKLNLATMDFHIGRYDGVFYQQVDGRFSAGHDIRPAMGPQDVPRGIYLGAGGVDSACAGWAVHKPELISDGYRVKVYCHSGSDGTCVSPAKNYCSVSVWICVPG